MGSNLKEGWVEEPPPLWCSKGHWTGAARCLSHSLRALHDFIVFILSTLNCSFRSPNTHIFKIVIKSLNGALACSCLQPSDDDRLVSFAWSSASSSIFAHSSSSLFLLRHRYSATHRLPSVFRLVKRVFTTNGLFSSLCGQELKLSIHAGGCKQRVT